MPLTKLFEPITCGSITSANRIWMAPLTRGRSSRDHVPDTELMAEYYAQRASIGLIISEATGISREGLGWPYAPGIWSQEQVEAWKPITKAVHDKGGKIVCQLWHMGRMVHSNVSGEQPVAPSAIAAPGQAHTYDGKKDYETPRELSVSEVPRLLSDYENAAKNSIAAGFDGIQIHAANGYLIDEFIRDGTNKRTDEYGGAPENRIRLLREVTERITKAIGSDRTSVRLSTNGEVQGCNDSAPEAVFLPAAKALQELNIAFLELRESNPETLFVPTQEPKLSPKIRKVFTNTLVLNQDYTAEQAEDDISSGRADAIAFGRATISNPDIVNRLAKNIPLAPPSDIKTWYSQGKEGYTDFPTAE